MSEALERNFKGGCSLEMSRSGLLSMVFRKILFHENVNTKKHCFVNSLKGLEPPPPVPRFLLEVNLVESKIHCVIIVAIPICGNFWWLYCRVENCISLDARILRQINPSLYFTPSLGFPQKCDFVHGCKGHMIGWLLITSHWHTYCTPTASIHTNKRMIWCNI